eukprot:362682-Chlamydomonas_euryale.AAC.6
MGCHRWPFEALDKPKGSSFSGENKDYIRFKLGDGTMIPAVEEAVVGMKVGMGVDGVWTGWAREEPLEI